MMQRITNYFTKWWPSIIGLLTSLFLYIAAITVIRREPFVEITLFCILLCEVSILISAMVHFIRLRWLTGLAQLALVSGFYVVFGFFVLFFPDDFYANSLDLPQNVKLEIPVGLEEDGGEEEIAVKKSEAYNLKFILVNSSQPGIYKYYVWIKPKERGTIYLKAFEITQNDPLSAERLKQRSAIKINSDSLSVYSREFTIYEGDWGYPYGARLEMWFKPQTGKDYKLLQKNYRIEGWMR